MRLMDGKRTLARLAVVGLLVGVEVYLARGLTSPASVQGYTATSSYSIAPVRAARIKELVVTLGAPVNAGDVIARLETSTIEDELATANAERRIAAGAMAAEAARLRRDSVDRERRFASGTERASADLVSAEATAHTAAAELAAIDAELVEQTDLVSKHLADASRLNNLQLKRAALAKQVDAATAVLRTLRGNAAAATKRTVGIEGDTETEDRLAPLQARIQAADLRISQLVHERDELTLRAPATGVIDALPLRAGDLASPQTPVAVLVAQDSRHVVACIPEFSGNTVEIGVEANVLSVVDRTGATGAVDSITSAISPLPARCQPPGLKTPLMGRVAIISLDEPLGGLPGQTQRVTFSARRRPHDRTTTPPVPTSPRTGELQPVELTVPNELAELNFEPSGMVWSAALDRYLIVSDDTGARRGDRHPAWLYTMTSRGVVDPQPLVIAGVDELNDLESIAADGRGFWVLASQSTSQRGNRPPARRRLAHLIVEPGATIDQAHVRADRVLDLGTLLDKASPELRAELGIASSLDIEAMAFRGGALYLGLKSPVDGAGRAVIWRIGAPDKLAEGNLAEAKLALWSTIKLTVDLAGKPVPAGFSDLIFWDDDTLVFAVTASSEGGAEDGAVYVAKVADKVLSPRRIQTFSRLKPEGLARNPKGDLAVVFDRGHQTPMWIELSANMLRDK